MHPESQRVYRVEVPKTVSPFWLLFPVNAFGEVGRSRDKFLPRISGLQDDLEGIHASIRLVCTILQKMSGGFLILRLEWV